MTCPHNMRNVPGLFVRIAIRKEQLKWSKASNMMSTTEETNSINVKDD